MKNLLLVTSLLLISVSAYAAEPQPKTSELIAQAEQQKTALRQAIEQKVAAVSDAITKASKAGKLKPSTDAYFREALARFHSADGAMSDPERLYFPPRFDSSEDMEPINLAWDELHREVTRAQEESQRLSQQLLDALSGVLHEAAASAEKPEDLASADGLVAALQTLPESGKARMPFTGATVLETARKTVAAMREALEAREKQDVDRLVMLLQRNASIPSGSSISSIRNGLSFRVDSLWEEFRNRLAAPFDRVAETAQAEVEKALITRKPVAEIDAAVASFETKAAAAEKLRASRTGYSTSGYSSIAQYYRDIGALEENLAHESVNGNLSVPTLSSMHQQYSPGAEFRAFVTSLKREITTKQNAAQRKAEEDRREEAAREQKQREKDEAERVARQNQELQDYMRKTKAMLHEKILAVKTPREALELAENLPGQVDVPEESRGRLEAYRENLTGILQVSLRTLAAQWERGEVPPWAESNLYARMGTSDLFVDEMQALRERALRDVAAARAHAPELSQPPFSEMSAEKAVFELAAQLGDRGDWKRSLALLQSLGPEEGRSERGERVTAIRAYLTGLNYEQAEQWPEAVESYQLVLQQITDHIPLHEADDRLKELRKTHPDAWQQVRSMRAPSPPALPRAATGAVAPASPVEVR